MPFDIAAIFTLGNTEEQCLFALRRILEAEGRMPDLYILHGETKVDGSPAPAESVGRLKTSLDALGVLRSEWKPTDAFSLDACMRDASELTALAAARPYIKVYLGITGGTNPMVAALFHAGMTALGDRAIPIYVRGQTGPSGLTQSIEMIRLTKSAPIH
jgi:hypothetical protein